MSLEGPLHEAGLHPKEAKVYLSLLALGKSTMSDISRQALLSHVTTLFHLRRLEEKKLITRKLEGKQKYYYIHNPKHGFHFYIQQLRDEVYKKESVLQDALDQYELRYNSLDNKPEVRFIQGDEAIKACQDESVNTKFEQMYEFVNLEEANKTSPPKRGDYRAKFRRARLRSKVIYVSEKGLCLEPRKNNIFWYNIPKEKFDFHGEMHTYADKIVFFTDVPSRSGVIIRNQSFAQIIQRLFQLALEAVDKYQHK